MCFLSVVILCILSTPCIVFYFILKYQPLEYKSLLSAIVLLQSTWQSKESKSNCFAEGQLILSITDPELAF